MEIYILDSLLRPIDVVDVFESMIWTERFSMIGQFELELISTAANRYRFVTGVKLSITKSMRIMEVETVEDTIDSEGRKLLKVKGSEIISVLERRLALNKNAGGNILPTWFLGGMLPAEIMRHIFHKICVLGSLSANDIIPLLVYGQSLYPPSTILEPTDLIDWEQKPASLYFAMKELADIYDLGFRLYRDPNVSRLLFDVYAGSNRTTQQTELPPIIFSQDLDNVLNTTEVSTISNTYNVAVVIWIETIPETTENGVVTPEEIIVHEETVYSDPNAPQTEGFERRVLLVEISNIPEDVLDIPVYLQQAGKDALMKARPIKAFDGEVSQHTQYVYERDYFLGDLVEMRNIDGATSNMRVFEQIFVQDAEGERSYPTLLIHEYVSQGTWVSWKYNVPWVDMGADEFWANQE